MTNPPADNPTPLWPAPVPRRGGHVRHGWRCDRRAELVPVTRRTPDGRIVEVLRCTGCDGTDYDPVARMLGVTQPPGGDAA